MRGSRCLSAGAGILLTFFLWNSCFVILPNARVEPFTGRARGDLTMDEGESLYVFRCPFRVRIWNVLNVEAILKDARRKYSERVEAVKSSDRPLMEKMQLMAAESEKLVTEYRKKYNFLNERFLVYRVSQGDLPRLLVYRSPLRNFGLAYRETLRVYVIGVLYVVVLGSSFSLLVVGLRRM